MHEVDIRVRFLLITMLENSISSLFPGITLEPFGSITSQLGSTSSDIDVRIAWQPTLHDKQTHMSAMSPYFLTPNHYNDARNKLMLETVANYLRISCPTFIDVLRLLHAKVPIVRCTHQTGIDIDIAASDK